ncbi:hypothetical protein LINPERHAP1_LOCUS41514 [Linum perenne]
MLTHVMFADDMEIFGRAELTEMERIKEVLKLYCTMPGQALNKEKSAIFFSKNTLVDRKRILADYMNIDLSRSLGNYLGLTAEWVDQKRKPSDS